MGLIFFLGIPLLPPRASIKAWGFGGEEKQLSIKDILWLASRWQRSDAGRRRTGRGAAFEVGLQPLLLRAP